MRRPGTNGDDNRVCCSRRPLDSGVTRDALFGFVGGVTPGRGQNAPRALLRAPESQSPHRAPRHKRRFAESTGVPAFRKRNDWPSGSLRFIEAQNVPLRGGCHDHSQGVQRQIHSTSLITHSPFGGAEFLCALIAIFLKFFVMSPPSKAAIWTLSPLKTCREMRFFL
jgi:hypothetical protein